MEVKKACQNEDHIKKALHNNGMENVTYYDSESFSKPFTDRGEENKQAIGDDCSARNRINCGYEIGTSPISGEASMHTVNSFKHQEKVLHQQESSYNSVNDSLYSNCDDKEIGEIPKKISNENNDKLEIEKILNTANTEGLNEWNRNVLTPNRSEKPFSTKTASTSSGSTIGAEKTETTPKLAGTPQEPGSPSNATCAPGELCGLRQGGSPRTSNQMTRDMHKMATLQPEPLALQSHWASKNQKNSADKNYNFSNSASEVENDTDLVSVELKNMPFIAENKLFFAENLEGDKNKADYPDNPCAYQNDRNEERCSNSHDHDCSKLDSECESVETAELELNDCNNVFVDKEIYKSDSLKCDHEENKKSQPCLLEISFNYNSCTADICNTTKSSVASPLIANSSGGSATATYSTASGEVADCTDDSYCQNAYVDEIAKTSIATSEASLINYSDSDIRSSSEAPFESAVDSFVNDDTKLKATFDPDLKKRNFIHDYRSGSDTQQLFYDATSDYSNLLTTGAVSSGATSNPAINDRNAASLDSPTIQVSAPVASVGPKSAYGVPSKFTSCSNANIPTLTITVNSTHQSLLVPGIDEKESSISIANKSDADTSDNRPQNPAINLNSNDYHLRKDSNNAMGHRRLNVSKSENFKNKGRDSAAQCGGVRSSMGLGGSQTGVLAYKKPNATALKRSQSARNNKPHLSTFVFPANSDSLMSADAVGHKVQPKRKISPNLNVPGRNMPQRSQSARYKVAPTRHQKGGFIPDSTSSKFESSAPGAIASFDHASGIIQFRDRAGSIPGQDGAKRYASYGWATPSDSTNQLEAQFLQLPGGENYERLRNFSIQKGCVINRGDSFRRRQMESQKKKCQENAFPNARKEQLNNSTNGRSSNNSSPTSSLASHPLAQAQPSVEPENLACQTSPQVSRKNSAYDSAQFKVCVLGARGSGKTSLITQFMTSDYTNPFCVDEDAMELAEDGQNAVSILLENVESKLSFTEVQLEQDDLSDPDFSVLNGCESPFDGYVMLFSTDNKPSFQAVQQSMQRLSARVADQHTPPMMLVANKIDLARKRTISAAECSSLAKAYNAKSVEISVALNHHVDELLVGLLAHLRLHRQKIESMLMSREQPQKLTHSHSAIEQQTEDECVRSSADNRSTSPLIDYHCGSSRGGENLPGALVDRQQPLTSGRRNRLPSGFSTNNRRGCRRSFRSEEEGPIRRAGMSGSKGVVSCASTFLSAKNAILGCLMGRRRPSSADSLVILQ